MSEPLPQVSAERSPKWPLWPADGQLPTTAYGAEMAIVILIVGMRVGTLIQMAPALPSGTALSPRPWLYVATWMLAALASVVISTVAIRRRRPPENWMTGLDVLLVVVLFVLGTRTLPPADRFGTWEGFVPAYALSVLLSACAIRGGVWWLSTVAATVVGSLFYLRDAGAVITPSTVLGNILTFIVLGVVSRAAVSYVRRIAADADQARAVAAELGRREEERRAQVAFHNGAAVMSLLGDPGLDQVTRSRLQEQARHEATLMRSYLHGDRTAAHTVPRGVTSAAPALAMTCAQFTDLPLEHALELGPGVVLDSADLLALQRALVSLLLNVRAHAGAELVVVDLDADDIAGRWMLTVHDDGRGFRPEPDSYGVGLGDLVIGELSARGMEVDIQSVVGVGTTVTVGAPLLGAAAARR